MLGIQGMILQLLISVDTICSSVSLHASISSLESNTPVRTLLFSETDCQLEFIAGR